MNLGTFCVFDYREMCCPRILYVVHFTEQLTLEEARTKMTEITGTYFSEGEYFTAGLDYVDCTRLYHQIQLGETSEEISKNIDILNRYRPKILDNVRKGKASNPLIFYSEAKDAAEYEGHQRFYKEITNLVDTEYMNLLAMSMERRTKLKEDKSN